MVFEETYQTKNKAIFIPLTRQNETVQDYKVSFRKKMAHCRFPERSGRQI